MPIAIPNYKSYYDQAYAGLGTYYQRLLTEEGGNVERVKRRLEEDYQRGTRIPMEDYVLNLAAAKGEHAASAKEQAITNTQESRGLLDNQLQRGISLGGLAQKQAGELKSKQDLRREAIDRALQKSEKELAYAKERSLEDASLTKIRGAEDTESNWQKFQTEKAQEREEKALQLGEQGYQREFQKNQAQESAAIADKQLAMQQEALNAARG